MTAVSRCLAALILLAPASLVQAQQDNQMLELIQQLTRLESEVRQLRGEVERLNHVNSRLKNRQADLFQNLDTRLRSLETGLPPGGSNTITLQPAPAGPVGPSAIVDSNITPAPASGSLTPTVVISGQPTPGSSPAATSTAQPVTSTAPTDPARERAAYKAAFNLLKVGKYTEAILAYTDFLKVFPSGKYAANAQYWLGEANYVTRQFARAIEEFEKVVKKYPQSRKLPDAMLKIGYIYYELKDTEAARQTLTELSQKHPGTTAARLAENRLQRMKLEGR